MQTVDLKLNVPVGYSIDEFVSKVNAYVASLAKKGQTDDAACTEPNKETIDAINEGRKHVAAYNRGEEWAMKGCVDTSSVESMLKSCGL